MDGYLWQFARLPFGATNGVSALIRATTAIVDGLDGTGGDIDDVVVSGATEADYDNTLAEF